MFKRALEYLFGFKECAMCNKYTKCNRKPYVHHEDDCNYRKINKR